MITTGSTVDDNVWMARGTCTNRDPRLWDGVPVNGSRYARLDFSKARSICLECPVRAICERRAVETGDIGAMRGGRTPDELKELAKEARKRRSRRSTKGLYRVVSSRSGPSVTIS